MGSDHIGADKLGYGFAMTAHRSQGATVGVTHALADGGGREPADVAMSRARGESHVYVVADDVPGAAERLAWEWGQERRYSWVIDTSPSDPWPNPTSSVPGWPPPCRRTAQDSCARLRTT